MDNQPLSSRFLKVMYNSIIAGTIPKESELRPHVQVSYSDSNLRGQSNPNAKTIGIIGPADDGIPNHVYKINSVHQAEHYFGGGPLVKGIQLAWQPGAIAYGNGGTVYAERVQDAGQADLKAGPLHFTSTSFGKKANNTNVSLKKDPLTNTWTVTVTNKPDDYKATYDGIGLLGLIQYIPNAWDKFHIPAGHHDYARATMEIKPQITTHVDDTGTVRKSYTGQSAKMVFHIHDTPHKGILYDNATNNVNGGSTVYSTNPDGTETLREVPDNAGTGNVNPNRGAFQDSEFTVDLTNPKFKNVTGLFNYLQNLPNIEVSLNDNHHLSHIAPTMLDLTQHGVNIMGNLDDTTQDKHGNIVHPGGIWATLADLVDKLRYDQEVHATADLSKQLNDISTQPSGVANFTSQAARDSNLAESASNDASYNNSEATEFKNNHLSNLASDYDSVRDSEKSVADSYASLASSANSAAYAMTNSLDSNVPAASKSASAFNSSEQVILDSFKNDSMKATDKATSLENEMNAANSGAKTEHSNNYNKYSGSASYYGSLANSIASQNSASYSTYSSNAASYSAVAESYTTLEESYSDEALYTTNAAQKAQFTNSANTYHNQASTATTSYNTYSEKAQSIASNTSASSDSTKAKSYASQANTPDTTESNDTSNANSYAKQYSAAKSTVDSIKANISSVSSAMKDEKNKATKFEEETLDKTANGDYDSNIYRVQTYVSNLIKQIRSAANNNADNIADTDLDVLSLISGTLTNPKDTKSADEYKAGNAMAKDIHAASEAFKKVKADQKNKDKKSLKKDNGQLNRNLDSLNLDLTNVDPSTKAPESIFTNEGEGQIFVLNQPINAFNDTALTGGYTKPVPASWANKLHAFDNTPVYDFVALSPHESVHAEVAAYIGDRYESSHNMRGFVGAGYNAGVQELVSRAAALDNERMVLVGTSGDFTIGEGLHEDIPAYMTAAIVAGIDSSLPVGDSILNKQIPFNRIDQTFSNNDLNTLDQNGVITANPVINRGQAAEYTISDDVTTDNDDADPVKSQLSIGEVTDFLFDGLRLFLNKDIGIPVTEQSSNQLANDVNEYLSNQCSAYNGGEGMIVDFNPDDTYCEIHNESAYIEFSVAPTMPLKFINVIGTYNGYDENSAGGFNMIGANGQEIQDNTDAANGLSSDDENEDSGNLTE